MTWIFLSIAAAAFQTLRFMLQKLLAMGSLSAGGATYARFLYSAPFVATLAVVYLWQTGVGLPKITGLFWLYALGGGLFQILATWAVVALFARRAFAVGITFKKTEVMQAALLGFIVLGDRVSPMGLGAIVLGMIGVIILSAPPEQTEKGLKKYINPAAGLGLLSGAFFAVSAVGYRGAVLQVGLNDPAGGPLDDPLARALTTLALVTLAQAIAMTLWLRLREPGQVGKVVAVWRKALWLGLAGLAGSLCWFTAFALQNAAYVFAVGQIEVIFSILVSILFFGERLSRREGAGITLLTGSIVALVVFA